MPKKSQHMTKNQKLDALRVDIAKILEAVETLTHRLDAVIPSDHVIGEMRQVPLARENPRPLSDLPENLHQVHDIAATV